MELGFHSDWAVQSAAKGAKLEIFFKDKGING